MKPSTNLNGRNGEHFKTWQQYESPLLNKFRRRLSELEPEFLATRFQSLYKAIMSTEPDLSTQDKKHLRSYIDLTNLLASIDNKEDLVSPLPPVADCVTERLSFLKPRAEKTFWTTQLQSRLVGDPFSLTFQFDITYLQTLFLPLSAAPARPEASVSPPASHLLLYQDVQIGLQMLTVEVTYTHFPAKPNNLVLQAMLVGLNPLPDRLWAYLTWGNQTLAAPVNDRGRVNFREISLTGLKKAIKTGGGDFEIAFKTQEDING